VRTIGGNNESWFPKSRLGGEAYACFGMRLSLHLSLPALSPECRPARFGETHARLLHVVRNGGGLGFCEKLFFRCNPHCALRTLIANQRLSLLVSLVLQGSSLALINARTGLEPCVRRRDIVWGILSD
jgi:hypothetical protein